MKALINDIYEIIKDYRADEMWGICKPNPAKITTFERLNRNLLRLEQERIHYTGLKTIYKIASN